MELSDLPTENRFLATVVAWPELWTDYAVDPEAFTDPRNRKIATAIDALVSRGEDPNAEALIDEAKRVDPDYILGFWSTVELNPDRTLPTLAARLRKMHVSRRMREALLLAASETDADEAQARIDALATELHEITAAQKSLMTLGEVCETGLREVFSDGKRAQACVGVDSVDQRIGSLGAGDLMIVGADTGVGKSSFLMMSAFANAAAGNRVGYIQCEDSPGTVAGRAIAHRAGINPTMFRNDPRKIPVDKIDEALKWLRKQGIVFSFEIGSTDADICRAMARMVREHEVDIVMVDYVQTIIPSERTQSRKEDIRTISARLKGTAARLGIPLMLASQLRRPQQTNSVSSVRPVSIHDLKECGDLENSAECIALLFRLEDTHEMIGGRLAKNKWGPNCEFRLHRTNVGTLVSRDPRAHSPGPFTSAAGVSRF